MKKTQRYVCLLSLICFAQINGIETQLTAKNYSNLLTNELGEALVTAVKKPIEAGANVNQEVTYTKQNYDDYDSHITCSVLEYASLCGCVNTVKMLPNATPNIDDINKALIIAAQEAEVDVVRELINHANKKSRDIVSNR